MYSSVIIITLSTFSGIAFASPLQIESRQTDGATTWSNPAGGGNINMFFSDATVNYGQAVPADLIAKNVSATCGTDGLCVQGSQDLGTYGIIVTDGLGKQDISYTAEGQYPSWIHNGFVSLLSAVMANQTKVHHKCYEDIEPCSGEANCPVGPKTCIKEYVAPAAVGVVQVNTEAATPGAMQVQFTVQQLFDTGLCNDLATVGAGLIGLVPEIGGIGGLFSIAALGCMS